MMQETSRDETKEWYLETSVLRTLQFGHSLSRAEIQNRLNGVGRRWSSHYVLMEYKRSVVKTLIDLYFVTLEEDTPSDAIQYFSQGFRPRETKLVLSALGKLIEEADIANDKEKFLLKLRTFIAGALQFFDDHVDEYVTNKTQCPLAKASTHDGYEQFLREIDCKMQCKVQNLWHESRAQLKKLVEGAKQPDHAKNDGFTKPLPLVAAAITNPSEPKSKLKCMTTGDFIIALQMPRKLRLLTFDKSFTSICGLLGKDVVVLPALATLRKQRTSTGRSSDST
jgi:hypothetical protein